MSLEIDGALDRPVEANDEPQNRGKISYSREFLLLLSELDVCKNLPSGFDLSVLSEFNDALGNVKDRQRNPGSFRLQSVRHGKYGTSPPTRGDLSNYSQGVHGRWDDHSSVSQPNADSERRYGNQSQRSWQNPEHDGLLGSGFFSRPSGYTAGPVPEKVQANDHYHLNRSTGPYQPPRPYKAVPPTRRDAKDSYNDETFGSSDCTSQDRVEEERKRRDSFDLMRKEQKTLQEKQKLNPDQHKQKLALDMSFLLEDSKDNKKIVNVENALDESQIEPGPHNGSSYLSSQALPSRPLVPPGFRSTCVEGKFGSKVSSRCSEEEVGNLQLQDSPLHVQDNPALNEASVIQELKHSTQNIGFSRQEFETRNIPAQHVDKGEKTVNSSTAFEISNKLNRMDNQSYMTSNVLEPCDTLDDSEIKELDNEKGTGHKVMSESGQDRSATILEKIFGTITINNGGTTKLFENHNDNEDEIRSAETIQSSKFAHWFLEEGKETVDDYSSGRSSNLLSLVGGDNGGFTMSRVESTEQIRPTFPFKSSAHSETHMMTSNGSSSMVHLSEQLYSGNKLEAAPAVLTCEDLEQSILSEISESNANLCPSTQGLSILDRKSEHRRAANDGHASQHLLSLLQKGAPLQGNPPSTNINNVFSDKLHVRETGNGGTGTSNPKQESPEKVYNSENASTLETLFGLAFMKELKDSVGSARIDASEPHGLSSSVVDRSFDNGTGHGNSVLPVINSQENKLGNIEGHWQGFDDPRNGTDPRNLRTEVQSRPNGFDTEINISLPEEESLFSITDPMNSSGSSFIPPVNATESQFPSPSNSPVEISGKKAALNAVLKDERHMTRSEGPPFLHSPYDLLDSEIPRQNLHHHSSSPQFIPRRTPLFHPFDSHAAHINPQLNLVSPESNIPHAVQGNHRFQGNMLRPHFQNPSTGLSSLDPRNHHSMLNQMHLQGNFPPPDLFRGLSRGSSGPSQPDNRVTGFLQDSNMMRSFAFGHPNRNFSSPGIPVPALDVGGGNNHPEMLQRILQMELGSNTKQMNPLTVANHAQGIYSHELETGFRYG